jgi:septal ring factor EnvC (AmiA/AmiB activator)
MRTRVVVLALLLGAYGCLPSKQDVNTAQAIIQIGDALNDVRQTQADLQDEIDSLKAMLAKRDTVIKQLANLAGVAIPP